MGSLFHPAHRSVVLFLRPCSALMSVKCCPSDGEPAAHRDEARELQPAEADQGRKPDRTFVREMEFVTVPEFESIPQ